MKILFTLLTVTILFLSSEITAQKHTITVKVPNISSNEGTVKFALYEKEGFLKTPIKTAESKIVDGKAAFTFEDVKSGEYAVTCFHDKNENRRMDFQSNGMPMEDYGASNNNMSFGPPQYNDAKFLVENKNISLEIKF